MEVEDEKLSTKAKVWIAVIIVVMILFIVGVVMLVKHLNGNSEGEKQPLGTYLSPAGSADRK